MLHRLFLLLALCAPLSPLLAQPVAVETSRQPSVIRVNVTNQPWDFMRPWGKRAPYSRRAIGPVIANQRVLVTAELVANANYIEFETADGGQKVPATVEVVDYEANLALLKTDDPEFLRSIPALEFSIANVGDTLSVLQLEANGNLLVTRGPMTTAEVTRYPIDDSSFLLYRMTAPLQFRDSSFTLPVLKDNKLVGLLMRYENQSNNGDVVPTPVIQHFLRDAAQLPYEGFPRAGIGFAGTRDPQFRRYVGLTDATPGGLYVTEIQRTGSAATAGLEIGDVLLRIDDQAVDQDGNYADPVYGKISVSHLLSTHHFDGDVVKLTIFRKGEIKEIPLKLSHQPVTNYVVEPYIIDRAPKFYILGGMVLQELSRQYLKEWGPDWQKKAPEELIHLDRAQNELFPEGKRKIVILSHVLPTDATMGYEDLNQLIVTKLNGQEVLSIEDIPKAIAKAENGLHKLEFSSDPTAIYLDAEHVATSDAILAKTYRLPALKRL